MMYNISMIEIKIEKNDENQRLDRFLKKYLTKASLSSIYKIIRKDVKVNGKRGKQDTILLFGDVVNLYLADDTLEKLRGSRGGRTFAKKQFVVVYEDDNILVVDKPFGLLTHGDKTEKKNHLANQVVDYLIEKGDYVPRVEKTFTPASVNRLDRNTTGLVIFGKKAFALKDLNRLMREGHKIKKYYLTIVNGKLEKNLHLVDKVVKDRQLNKVSLKDSMGQEGQLMETFVRPIKSSNGYTLAQVEIVTGRTHQIRAHLAMTGHGIIGDVKYGKASDNGKVRKKFGLNTQLLHAYKLEFNGCTGELAYLNGKVIEREVPENFKIIEKEIFGE